MSQTNQEFGDCFFNCTQMNRCPVWEGLTLKHPNVQHGSFTSKLPIGKRLFLHLPTLSDAELRISEKRNTSRKHSSQNSHVLTEHTFSIQTIIFRIYVKNSGCYVFFSWPRVLFLMVMFISSSPRLLCFHVFFSSVLLMF